MRLSVLRRGVAISVGVIACLVLASVAVGSASVKNPTYNLKKLRGDIVADGSSTVGPYTTATAELFRRAGATNVRVTVGISGTGGGFSRFCRGEIDLSDASRPMRIAEAKLCQDNNVVPWNAFTVANDALTVVVSKQNTWARCLSVAELKSIWEPGSKVDNWNDVRQGFPDVPLRLFGPGTDSGTFEYFTEAINGRARASRTDYQASEDDNVLVQGVSGDRGGMGYFGYSYFVENKTRLNAVQIRNPKTNACVTPNEKSVHEQAYKPLSRPLFVYVKGTSFKKKHVQAFLDYMFDNEVRIANRSAFISLTPAQLKRARHHFHFQLLKLNRGG
jgi:phosphate transport system substrate-binding protein